MAGKSVLKREGEKQFELHFFLFFLGGGVRKTWQEDIVISIWKRCLSQLDSYYQLITKKIMEAAFVTP